MALALHASSIVTDAPLDIAVVDHTSSPSQSQSDPQPRSQNCAAGSAMASSRHKNLASLPPELLRNIASFLPTNDFNALRVTCKQLEDKIFPYWANTFFKKRQFMISQFSLQTLLDISQHPTLSQCMQHLIIGLDNFRGVQPRTLDTLREYESYRTASVSQGRLLDTGAAIHLISRALASLPNVKTVDIRDFNSPTRYRDTQDTRARAASARAPEWRSYGYSEYPDWRRLYVSSSLVDSFSQGIGDFVDRVFKLVLTALSRGAASIQSLEVLFRNTGIALRDDAFAFDPVLDVGIPAFLLGLKKLHLHLSIDTPTPISTAIWSPVLAMRPPPLSVFDPTTANVRRFLSFTPNVTWLRLNFVAHHPSLASASLLLSWLALKPGDSSQNMTGRDWSDYNPEPVDLPLTRLDLGNFSTNPETLSAVVNRFQKLEYLSLRRIVLTGDPSKYANDEVDHGSPWPRFFRQLRARAPKLKRLGLHNLGTSISQPRGAPDILKFMDHTGPMLTNRVTKDLEGIDKDDTALERLAESIWTDKCHRRVHKPDQTHANSDEEDLDSDSNSDEDDMDDEFDGDGEEDEDGFADMDPDDIVAIIGSPSEDEVEGLGVVPV